MDDFTPLSSPGVGLSRLPRKRCRSFCRAVPIHYSLTAIVAEFRNRKKGHNLHEICMHETSPPLPRWRPDEIYQARSKLQIEFEGVRKEGKVVRAICMMVSLRRGFGGNCTPQ